MSLATFYCPHIPSAGECTTLGAEEARHASGARRLRNGDQLRLIDGCGTWARAAIESIGERKKSLQLRILLRQRQAEPGRKLELATAVPKGDRQLLMVDMAVQLGTTGLTPLQCQRGLPISDHTHNRWHKIAIEACKQSGRLWLPNLHPVQSMETVVADCRERGQVMCLAHPQGEISTSACLELTRGRDVCILVGPQGGFCDDEVALALNNGAIGVFLGDTILRIETAVVALLSVFSLYSIDEPMTDLGTAGKTFSEQVPLQIR